MSVAVTAEEFTEITGVTAEQAGEANSSATAIRDAKIVKAILEFEKDAGRAFDSAEDDYGTAQESAAFLAAHLLMVSQQPLTFADGQYSVFLAEYKRKLKLLKTTHEGDKKVEFTGDMISYQTRDLSGAGVFKKGTVRNTINQFGP